jgi:hypothetical protein
VDLSDTGEKMGVHWGSKACMGKHLSDAFPIQNGLKQGDALSPLLLNFTSVYDIRKFQKKSGDI